MEQMLQKLVDENESQYIWRIGQAKDSGLITYTWEELTPTLNKQCGIDEADYRGESAWRKRYRVMQQAWDDVFSKIKFDSEYSSIIEEQKRELQKEKIKVQTEKLEYNRWLREEARNELIGEHVVNAIKLMPPLKIPTNIGPIFKTNNRSAVLLISDSHYGAELSIKGLFGETMNEYSPEIFEKRMWDLFNQVTYIVGKEGFTELNVYDLGDDIDGMLRVSQLMQLRYGVIESTVRYGRFITEWLNELTKYVRVKYQMVRDSNHNQLRLLNGKKNTFSNENVSYIITEKIMDRLEGNPNFEFIQNPTGYIFDNLVGGHKHHSNSKNIGIESDVIGAPSIIGIDDYSMALKKTSDPGATLFVLEQGVGKVMEYNIKL